LKPGGWQVALLYRQATSDLHYQGREAYPQLDPFGPVNRQKQLNLDATYGITKRFSASLNVPVVFNSFAVNRAPRPGAPLEWGQVEANGFGDVSVRANYWLFKPREGGTWNLQLSAGLKLPTGKAGVRDTIYGREVPVDVSVQPGDKAWAPIVSLQGFRSLPFATIFGSANYMFNARGGTNVPTFFGSLNNPNNRTVNSSQDQFVYQVGASINTKKYWPVPIVAYRINGVPVWDVFGSSVGFRRPGTVGFFEPGLSYTVSGHTFTVTTPIMTYVNVKDSPQSTRIEDATVPRYALTISWVKRFR
jgi:hypothetical protein